MKQGRTIILKGRGSFKPKKIRLGLTLNFGGGVGRLNHAERPPKIFAKRSSLVFVASSMEMFFFLREFLKGGGGVGFASTSLPAQAGLDIANS